MFSSFKSSIYRPLSFSSSSKAFLVQKDQRASSLLSSKGWVRMKSWASFLRQVVETFQQEIVDSFLKEGDVWWLLKLGE